MRKASKFRTLRGKYPFKTCSTRRMR
jgi:hypothetical protein